MLTVGEHGLLKDLLSIDFFKVWLVLELLKVLAYLPFLNNIDVVGFLTLLEDARSSLFHLCLELASDQLSLPKVQIFEHGYFFHLCKNLVKLASLLLEDDRLIIFVLKIEQMGVLDCPCRSETPSRSDIAQVRPLFIVSS